MFGGDYSGRRHSPLTQVTPQNVSRLAHQWTFQTGTLGMFETTPLVHDGVLYVTGANNYAWALDARTGQPFWRYRRELPDDLRVCCGPVNRGFAVARQPAVHDDARRPPGGARRAGPARCCSTSSSTTTRRATPRRIAPLVVKNKVIVGVAGGEYGAPGFIDAYDVETGKRVWRHSHGARRQGEPGSETWPADSAERGGAGVWVTGSYDPELNLVFYGTGNPSPDFHGDDRKGDNLFSNSLLALDADTGKRRWHYQFTPHDIHDWDSTHVPILADLTIGGQTAQGRHGGQPQRLLLHARPHQRQAAGRPSRTCTPPGRRRSAPTAGRCCCPNNTPDEKGSVDLSRPVGRHQLLSAVVTIRTCGCSSSTRARPARRYFGWKLELQARRVVPRRSDPEGRRAAGHLRRAARHRSGHR